MPNLLQYILEGTVLLIFFLVLFNRGYFCNFSVDFDVFKYSRLPLAVFLVHCEKISIFCRRKLS